MSKISSTILVIAININGYNLPIDRHRSQNGKKKKKSVIRCIQDSLETKQLRKMSKIEYEKIFKIIRQMKQKKAINIWQNIRKVKNDTKGYYILVKVTIERDNIAQLTSLHLRMVLGNFQTASTISTERNT